MPREGLRSSILENNEGPLKDIGFLEKYLEVCNFVAFSETCQAARRISSDVRKKQALKSLLTAVVCDGNEYLARKIVMSRPELLLDLSAIVTDISGKEIKELTPLQAAMCAGDVEMVQMIKEVLHQKIQDGVHLSFDPETEIQNQFKAIYPNGIDSVEAEQQVTAQAFKTSKLNQIFAAINTATPEQVNFELDNPGVQNADSQLNTDLHNFRIEFSARSNQEQIFNPFYLLKEFEFYDEQVNNFSGNENDKDNRRDLFWRQVIGYTQRHLPACYLQAFAQGIDDIVENSEKLKRDFELRDGTGPEWRAMSEALNNLGRPWVGWPSQYVAWFEDMGPPESRSTILSKLIANKKTGLENLFIRRVAGNYSYRLPSRCVIT